jgi:hypothetical protein
MSTVMTVRCSVNVAKSFVNPGSETAFKAHLESVAMDYSLKKSYNASQITIIVTDFVNFDGDVVYVCSMEIEEQNRPTLSVRFAQAFTESLE